MADLTGGQIDAALERGRAAQSREPRAVAARYDRRSRRVVVELTNGCTFAFPPGLTQGLELAGLFGTKTYLARQAGRATSLAKATASRANGAKGGRPRHSA